MQNNAKVQAAINLMEPYLINGDPELLKELYRFGEVTGKLSKPQILQMWNGVRLNNFDTTVLEALFEFLSHKFNIGEITEYFESKRQTVVTSDSETLERKEKYLATLDDNNRSFEVSVLSRAMKNIESVFHKDLCEMNNEELLAGLSNMGYINLRAARNDLVIIRKYVDWCSRSGYFAPATNSIGDINVNMIGVKKSIRDKIVPSPEKLRDIIDITKDKDEFSTDVVVIILYWLGLTLEEICELKDSEVDLIGGRIQNNYFGSIPIPTILIKYLRNYIQTDVIYTDNITRVVMPSEYFIKKFVIRGSSDHNNRLGLGRIKVLPTEFKSKFKNQTGDELKLSGKTLQLSGACWRIYQRELNGEDITDKILQYESRISSYLSTIEFRRTYNLYKELFCGT
ncbi:hypothetical protein SDC9_57802 [bioreactor metagenome]|uniref:MrpR N-terminal core-binding domain-containing protein n=1 Tax=bioreactor metagenome TaxID=1076179 RepID=A0A644X6L3_9ZZZZ